MKSRYSYRQQTLIINGKKLKRLPHESRSQYWDRYWELIKQNNTKDFATPLQKRDYELTN